MYKIHNLRCSINHHEDDDTQYLQGSSSHVSKPTDPSALPTSTITHFWTVALFGVSCKWSHADCTLLHVTSLISQYDSHPPSYACQWCAYFVTVCHSFLEIYRALFSHFSFRWTYKQSLYIWVLVATTVMKGNDTDRYRAYI